jgi:citrate lyase subunit beta/citryl-CoA lyase
MVTRTLRPPIAPLFVPGNRPERFAKAAESGADAIILDLEDSVAPDLKDVARSYVTGHAIRSCSVIVRVNARGTAWFDADLAALASISCTAVMLPKAETAADLAAVRAQVGGNVLVVPLVETARGLAGLGEMLLVSGVWCLAFGSLDFALDLDCADTWEALLLARSEIVLRARLAGLPAPIDGVTTVFDDPEVIDREARRSASLGFGGKLTIHPDQVASTMRAFMPDTQTCRWAERVIAAAQAGGVTHVDGGMVDRPVVERALRILEKARLPSSLNQN